MSRNGGGPTTLDGAHEGPFAPRELGLLALGLFLARRGVTVIVALVLSAACVVGFSAMALIFAHRGRTEALPGVPLVASTVLALGVGVLVALGASSRIFRSDEDGGIRGLLSARGVNATAYLGARIAGLAAVLGVLVGGGSGVVGLVATLAARGRTSALHTAQASVAAVVFSLAFAVTFAPVAMATLAARSRAGGYLVLLAVLVAPELVAPALGRLISPRWLDVCSIPGALLAVRTALAPVGIDPFMLGRGLAAILAIVVVALLIVRAELAGSRHSRLRDSPT